MGKVWNLVMPEKIAMTPPDKHGASVEWLSHNIAGQPVVLPQGGNIGYGSLLAQMVNSYPHSEGPSMEFIQEGDSADSFRIESLGIFLRRSVIGLNEAPSTWLMANLVFQNALERAQVDFGALVDVTEQKLRIKTPQYLSYLCVPHPKDPQSRLELAVSQDVSKGRSALPDEEAFCTGIEKELEEVGEFIVNHYYPGLKIHLDCSSPNLLIGKHDIAKIDCDSIVAEKDAEVTLWQPPLNLHHCG
jgi:hypothetical protein